MRSSACSGRTVAVGTSHWDRRPHRAGWRPGPGAWPGPRRGWPCRRRRWPRRREDLGPLVGEAEATPDHVEDATGGGHDLGTDAVARELATCTWDPWRGLRRVPRRDSCRCRLRGSQRGLRHGRHRRCRAGLVPEQLLERGQVRLEGGLDDVRGEAVARHRLRGPPCRWSDAPAPSPGPGHPRRRIPPGSRSR